MLRNPREGKVGEAVADFSLKFPQQSHLFTWLLRVQKQGHTHSGCTGELESNLSGRGDRAPRGLQGAAAEKSRELPPPTPLEQAGIAAGITQFGRNDPFLGWTSHLGIVPVPAWSSEPAQGVNSLRDENPSSQLSISFATPNQAPEDPW